MKLNLFAIALLTFFNFGDQKQGIGIAEISDAYQSGHELRFMFYNTENLFDTFDDSTTLDNDFLPEGNYHWTKNRYTSKINKVYKVIAGVGGWTPPDIIGLCEIENRYVLEQLTKNTPLLKHNYKIVHKNSPDRRGIDVGLLYNLKTISPIKEEFINVNDFENSQFLTRDILYFKCLAQKDTLHFFINHWPSRWGGQFQSEPKRLLAAKTLRLKVDSIFIINPASKIIVSGDFNDTPSDKSLTEILNAKTNFDPTKTSDLYNLSFSYCNNQCGTHKYREGWACLDQIIVSGGLLMENNMYTTPSSAHVFAQPFLLEDDTKYNGQKPFRTYIGMRYNGGFSDHLPVYLDLFLN